MKLKRSSPIIRRTETRRFRRLFIWFGVRTTSVSTFNRIPIFAYSSLCVTGGLIKEYEENLKAYQEQQLRDQQGPSAAGPSTSKPVKGKGKANHAEVVKSAPHAANGESSKKGKRRATPVFTDSESDDD